MTERNVSRVANLVVTVPNDGAAYATEWDIGVGTIVQIHAVDFYLFSVSSLDALGTTFARAVLAQYRVKQSAPDFSPELPNTIAAASWIREESTAVGSTMDTLEQRWLAPRGVYTRGRYLYLVGGSTLADASVRVGARIWYSLERGAPAEELLEIPVYD